jgi:hypothetical protein
MLLIAGASAADHAWKSVALVFVDDGSLNPVGYCS